jgi:HEPN domain-containing protein
MQPETEAEARAWFQKAANDLRGADIDLTANPPLIEDALFHCQQAAEKSMKGFLAAHEQVFRKTHDLDELGRKCENIDPSLISRLTAARDLTVFAWEFRYPGDTEIPSEGEAKDALATAQSVFDEILSRLPESIRP